MAAAEQINESGRIIERNLEDVMHQSMMPYSEHVILDRALPRVEDGLKPVQRRILYSMLELGITPDKQYRKSARVVGDCLGKYHPHGDTSVYGAMVRLAQPFNQSEILVDGHGNFGSVDGDSAAAMRYTEVKLMPIAMEMLRDIEKDTVKWTLNFDDTCKEPETLPGRFPNLLVNGASGIAVGLATDIPPHNICEVVDGVIALIDKPGIKTEEMMQYIKAPDFPTGAYVIVGDDLVKAYETGRGRVVMRAKAVIEKDGEKRSIVITELPYQVIKATLLQKISDLRESRKELFGNIADVVDESDRNGMRAVIKIKREGDANKILQGLYKYTDLEKAFNINMVAIADGKPQQLGLIKLMKYYVEYQRQVIYRRSQYDLNMAKAREHILQGILIAILNIDKVIKIIRSSANVTDCKSNLRAAFDISEKQAQAILDIKLARLTKLETANIKNEIEELLKKIAFLQGVVASKTKQLKIVKEELLEIRKTYKRARRSTVVSNGVIQEQAEELDINYVEERSGIAVLSGSGNVKFLSKKAYNMATKTLDNASLGDICVKAVECDNSHPLYAFTDKGNCALIDVNSLSDDKWRNKGTALSKLIQLSRDERVVEIFSHAELEKNNVIFYTAKGMIKCSAGSEYFVDKKNFAAITLKDDDRVVGVEIKEDDKTVFMATEGGICCNMEADVPVHGRRASGVIGISLNEGDKVIYAGQIDDEGEIIVITDNGYAKRVIASFIKISKRNRKGIKLQDMNAKTGENIAFVGYVKQPYDIALIGDENGVVGINSEDISIENTISKGKALKNISGKVARAIKHNLI